MSTRSPRRARDISFTPTSATAIRFRPSREDNKVSLYVSYISLADGSSDTIIINKHDQEEEA